MFTKLIISTLKEYQIKNGILHRINGRKHNKYTKYTGFEMYTTCSCSWDWNYLVCAEMLFVLDEHI
jgi:hypothetical protein